MKRLLLLAALANLCFALETAVFDARDMPSKFDTFAEPIANRIQYEYYISETGNDSMRNCGTALNDVPCQTYSAAKDQFFKKPTAPNPTDSTKYPGGKTS